MSVIKIGLITAICLFAKVSDGNDLVIKLNSTDCVSCLFGLNQVNSVKSTIKLKVLINESQDTINVKKLVSSILERKWSLLVSDSFYYKVKFARSSYYLFNEAKYCLDSGYLDQIDVSIINFIASTNSAVDTNRIAASSVGKKIIKLVKPNCLIALTPTNNCYEIINLKNGSCQKVVAGQFEPLVIYTAIHQGDTSGYWSRVIRRSATLRKYGMHELKLESISTKDDSCFFLATFFEVEKMRNGTGYDNYFRQRLLLLVFCATEPSNVKLLPIRDLPSKHQKRYGLDNTQQVYLQENSVDLLIGVYKDNIKMRKPIFAQYKRKKGYYLFEKFSREQLPKTFIKDELIYEGNLYDVTNAFLFFVQTGDFINLKSGDKGNIDLGKTIVEKNGREIKVEYHWVIVGFGKISNEGHLVLFLDEGLLKAALFNNEMKLKNKWVLTEFQEIGISSNVIINSNGILMFIDDEGYLVSL